jgi:hypothetical protein
MVAGRILGTIQSGALGRWFEELCRIKYKSLREIVVTSGLRLGHERLPVGGGVYVFWWTGPISILRSKKCYRLLELKGPGSRPVSLKIDDEWMGLKTKLPIPIYVGKNAANIAKRVGQHLRLKDKRMFPIGNSIKKRKAPTTSCQLRAGIEHMFPREIDTRKLILDNIGLSFVILDGDINAANRFYLEDLAIGMMKPPFNVDIER